MSIILPAKLEIKEAKNNRAEIVIEPCYPGYGVTLGNALRRVLLSSLEGAAITAFKIKGAMHEFSSLPNIKEDLVELTLNLKKVRLKIFTDEPLTLNLKVKGEKVATAGDLEKNADVQVVIPQQEIATLTDKSAELEMELLAQKGKGYLTIEERSKEKVELGMIMIDSLFSPVVNVGFEVEHVRVGERTDYDKLILKIETDGSLTPKEALIEAAKILVDHFNFVINFQTPATKKEASQEKVKVEEKKETGESSIKEQKITAAEEKPKRKRGRPKKTE